MPNSTGLVYNPVTGETQSTQVIVTCINDSLNAPANIELEVFRWDTTQTTRIPVGHELFQLTPQATRTFIYPLLNAAFLKCKVIISVLQAPLSMCMLLILQVKLYSEFSSRR